MQIVPLDKQTWKGHILPMPDYTATEHYAVRITATERGAEISLEKRPMPAPLAFTPEAYGNPDRLYADHFAGARAYAVMDGETPAAVMEICPEEWNNRMRITELWVREDRRRKGLGGALVAFAKSEAVREGRRALVLETQSCNTGAIAFYRRAGFSLIGLDTCCYSNEDVSRGEVRLELGMLL